MRARRAFQVHGEGAGWAWRHSGSGRGGCVRLLLVLVLVRAVYGMGRGASGSSGGCWCCRCCSCTLGLWAWCHGQQCWTLRLLLVLVLLLLLLRTLCVGWAEERSSSDAWWRDGVPGRWQGRGGRRDVLLARRVAVVTACIRLLEGSLSLPSLRSNVPPALMRTPCCCTSTSAHRTWSTGVLGADVGHRHRD